VPRDSNALSHVRITCRQSFRRWYWSCDSCIEAREMYRLKLSVKLRNFSMNCHSMNNVTMHKICKLTASPLSSM